MKQHGNTEIPINITWNLDAIGGTGFAILGQWILIYRKFNQDRCGQTVHQNGHGHFVIYFDLFCSYVYIYTSFRGNEFLAIGAPQSLTHAETVVDNQATRDVREALLGVKLKWSYHNGPCKLLSNFAKLWPWWPSLNRFMLNLTREHFAGDTSVFLPMAWRTSGCVHCGSTYHTISHYHTMTSPWRWQNSRPISGQDLGRVMLWARSGDTWQKGEWWACRIGTKCRGQAGSKRHGQKPQVNGKQNSKSQSLRNGPLIQ